MKLLAGKSTAEEIKHRLTHTVRELSVVPKLVIVRVGDREDSKRYVSRKVAFAHDIGVEAEVLQFPADSTEAEVQTAVREKNADSSVHGIIVQLPLPEHIDPVRIIDEITPVKDVDGLSIYNLGTLAGGEPNLIPATPRGILTLLQRHDIQIAGKHVVVVGRSRLVGKSVALLLLAEHATVTICHSQTQNLSEYTKRADILIVAIGKQKYIGRDHVCDGQVIVDVGIGADDDNKLTGDVDFEAVQDMDITISPVPGGVGPMTVAALFENLIDALAQQSH